MPQVAASTLSLYVTISGNEGPWLEIKFPAAIGPRTPMWSLAAAGSGRHHCPQQRHGLETLTWPLNLGVCKTFEDNRSIRHQHRPWLQLGHRFWHGSQLQLVPRCRHMALSCSLGPGVTTISLSSSARYSDINAFWSLVTNPNSAYWFDPGFIHGAWRQ